MASSSSPSPMLSIPEKKATSADLYSTFRQHISTRYSEREAQLQDDDLRAIHTLRTDLLCPIPSSSRRDLLISYSCALSSAILRFPSLPLHVTWHDAFRPSRKATSTHGLPFDRAATLFCLASAYTHIAAAEDRRSEDGRKAACNAYMFAAGALSFLRLRVSPDLEVASLTVDLTLECVEMLEKLMLAQAQECFFEKVIADAKSHLICSKVAKQVSLYYEAVNSALKSAKLGQHVDKAWICNVKVKAALFHAEACYRIGLDLHEREETGEEIARLKDGIKTLSKVKKSAKGTGADLFKSFTKIESEMNSNLAKAMRENDHIYLLQVPATESLESLLSISLVKPMEMDDLLDGNGQKFFAGVLPDGATKALSRYAEMVDDIIRIQVEKLQQEAEITRVKLKEMDLPDCILALEGKFHLPADLKKDVETVQVAGGLSALEADLIELENLRTVNQELIVQVEEILEKEERDDDKLRTQFGTRWTRPPSRALAQNMYDRLGKLVASTNQASKSDARVQQDVKDNSELLAGLDRELIESAIPRLEKPITSLDEMEAAIVGTLKESLRQLESQGAQRAGLEERLKEMKRKDDIQPKLMVTNDSHEDLFKTEILKYDPICDDIVQKIQAQENLLHEIQVQNGKLSAIFNMQDFKVQQERFYKRIADAVAKYREIKACTNEGLKFYVALEEAVTNLRQQCSDFVMTRGIECQGIIQDVQGKIANINISSDKWTGYGYPSSSLPAPRPQEINPHNEHYDTPYTHTPPLQQFNQAHPPYQPPSPPQHPNPQDEEPNKPQHLYPKLGRANEPFQPPPEQSNRLQDLSHQPYRPVPPPGMPEAWNTPARQSYSQPPPPYYPPPYEQRYPQPPYPPHAPIPQPPPPYSSPRGNLYQPPQPPPRPSYQVPYAEYGEQAYYNGPQHHGVLPQHSTAHRALEKDPQYASYYGVPR